MKDSQNKPDMKRYDYLGLVEQLLESEKDQMYVLGAMEAHGDSLSTEDLREGYNEQLRLNIKSGSGLELAIQAHSKKYKANREKTTLGEFCDIYSVDDYIKGSLAKYSGETIGEIMDKVGDWSYILKDPKKHFTKEEKEEKEEAKKNIEEYQSVISKIKLVEDKRFAQLKINAIERTKQDMAEEEKRGLEKKAVA